MQSGLDLKTLDRKSQKEYGIKYQTLYCVWLLYVASWLCTSIKSLAPSPWCHPLRCCVLLLGPSGWINWPFLLGQCFSSLLLWLYSPEHILVFQQLSCIREAVAGSSIKVQPNECWLSMNNPFLQSTACACTKAIPYLVDLLLLVRIYCSPGLPGCLQQSCSPASQSSASPGSGIRVPPTCSMLPSPYLSLLVCSCRLAVSFWSAALPSNVSPAGVCRAAEGTLSLLLHIHTAIQQRKGENSEHCTHNALGNAIR